MKTRLALHLAADLQRSFTDGVWLAELSALRNAELLARTVAASLGLSEECLRISEELGEQWCRGTALWTRGAARWLSGDVGHAI